MTGQLRHRIATRILRLERAAKVAERRTHPLHRLRHRMDNRLRHDRRRSMSFAVLQTGLIRLHLTAIGVKTA